MAVMQSFAPGYGTGVSVTATTTTAASALPGATSTALCLTNSGTNVVYVRTGISTTGLTATAADYPVLGGQQAVITINSDHKAFACLAAASTSDLHVMRGEGF